MERRARAGQRPDYSRRGGRSLAHGEPPSLTNLDNGNLRFTTDFRSIYATLLEKWLQAPAKDILGESFPQLDLLRA